MTKSKSSDDKVRIDAGGGAACGYEEHLYKKLGL
jgi:phosphomannomutase